MDEVYDKNRKIVQRRKIKEKIEADKKDDNKYHYNIKESFATVLTLFTDIVVESEMQKQIIHVMETFWHEFRKYFITSYRLSLPISRMRRKQYVYYISESKKKLLEKCGLRKYSSHVGDVKIYFKIIFSN